MLLLYNRIEELCNSRGITGYRMCKDCGITPSIVTDLKMGRRNGLSARNASKIADYFGVSVAYLLGEEDKKITPSVDDVIKMLPIDEQALVKAYRVSSPETKEIIRRIING